MSKKTSADCLRELAPYARKETANLLRIAEEIEAQDQETARLRASHAELLAALKSCSYVIDDKALGSTTWSRIHKAIANAEKML